MPVRLQCHHDTAEKWSMKRVFMLAVVLSVVPATSSAQSGVLIGMATRYEAALADDTPPKADSFHTVWIAHTGPGRVQAGVTLPSLVVPRRDGFWRVGVTNVCERTDNTTEDDRFVIWTAKLLATPVIEVGRRCGPVRPVPEVALWELREKGIAIRCHRDLVTLRFVSPDLVSGERYSGPRGWCEERGWMWSESEFVARFGTETAVSFLSAGVTSAAAAYRAALERGFGDTLRDEFNCDPPEYPDGAAFDGWSIQRGPGRWRAHAFWEPQRPPCQYQGEIDVTLPRSLVGPETPPALWDRIRRVVPGAIDAFSSPANDMVVVATDAGELLVFEIADGALGRRLTNLPGLGDTVMIEWALGANVERWTKTLTEAARRPFREPVQRRRQSGRNGQ
jgi:hypothetical protein